MSAALVVENLGVRYGGVTALRDVSLSVDEGQILTVLGANGAGKTSMLRGISGLVSSTGTVTHHGRTLGRLDAAARARAGLGHVLEGRHVFPDLTVRENLHLGSLLSPKPAEGVERALALLPELEEMAGRKAGRLSGGQQQMLAIARAISGSPSVLLLDEPTNGLAPMLVQRTIDVIGAIQELGVAVLLVEQRVEVAQALGSEVLVLQRGEVVGTAHGTDDDLEDRIHTAYLA
ncbi:ABC transporter ATP-binding protein [Nonomuraea harbinensis]|uniref:ABC transporter ATP-binding protein n=1 Tax=Nonomuraea harbinensis TaxID=1286938 RepID=A0ABW1CC35_9ACTN|nr:ATP-binding cassette domain-containing protein [Nonomuraea harbinensis]